MFLGIFIMMFLVKSLRLWYGIIKVSNQSSGLDESKKICILHMNIENLNRILFLAPPDTQL